MWKIWYCWEGDGVGSRRADDAQTDLDDLRQWLCDPQSRSPFSNNEYTNLEIHLHKAKIIEEFAATVTSTSPLQLDWKISWFH